MMTVTVTVMVDCGRDYDDTDDDNDVTDNGDDDDDDDHGDDKPTRVYDQQHYTYHAFSNTTLNTITFCTSDGKNRTHRCM